MVAALSAFGRQVVAPDFFEARNPGSSDDTRAGVIVGSLWINSSTGAAFVCADQTQGAAVWTAVAAAQQGQQAIGQIIGANMNVTTDQPFVFSIAAGVKFRINAIRAVNPSTSLTTAAGGIYPTTAKGGTPIVAAGQVYSGLTGVNLYLALTLAAITNTTIYTPATGITLSLTTPQGGAATADFYLYGDILPTG